MLSGEMMFNVFSSGVARRNRADGWKSGLGLLAGMTIAWQAHSSVVMNELHYDPDIKTEAVEFVELYNNGAAEVDLSGWTFSDGIEFVFPDGTTLPAGGYRVVCENPQAFQSKFGVEAMGPWEGQLANEGEEITLRNAAGDVMDEVDYQRGFPWPIVGDPPGYSMELVHAGLDNNLGGSWRASVVGENVLAVQGHNASLSGSSDFWLDVRLRARIGTATRGPTPGALNSVWRENIPPQLRQLDHDPEQPVSGQPVTFTVKATDPDGVETVELHYQTVDPGQYIAIDDPAYKTDWTTLAMNDAGTDGDPVAADQHYTVTLPGTFQTHRRLIRYRITATDSGGRSVTVPYPNDPQPNFAYFVYDGVPGWRGAVDPGRTAVMEFDAEEMGRLPVYHLLSKNSDVEDATWNEQYAGSEYKWRGTLIYGGEVYDHIRYRMRGGGWRYSMGKNMWKFDFNRGHYFQARDNHGREYDFTWDKLNLGANIQQGDYEHRGEQGMFESVGFRLFNLAGVESPRTHWVTFRIIDAEEEADPNNQYEGDFWGLYLVVEQPDGRMLDEHGLPDGNFYKMEGGGGELNNQGPTHPTDKSDLNEFLNTYRNSNPSESWWREHFDLHRYYSYQTIAQGIHHYDICFGKNYFYYHHPETDRWSVHAWDLDLTWADNMFLHSCGGRDEFYDRVLTRQPFDREFANRIRELRDLLFNQDQAFKLIDEYARIVQGPDPDQGPTILDADRAMWDYNPVMVDSSRVNLSKAGHGRFYEFPLESGTNANLRGTFSAGVQIMKNYVEYRSGFLDDLASDSSIPDRPEVTATGPGDFPVNQLTFRCSDYQGETEFAGMQFRIAEVSDSMGPDYDPSEPLSYEIQADWESPILGDPNGETRIPAEAVKVGKRYRVRARMQDTAGRWSHWSSPVTLQTTPPDNATALADHLRITELMYDPPAGNDFEFVELHNSSESVTLDLSGVAFTDGIEFTFSAGQTLEPGGYVLLVQTADVPGFRSHYGLDNNTAVVGPYTGNLSNGGEQVTLRTAAAGSEILSFTYGDGRSWPQAADGAGHSLVPVTGVTSQSAGALNYAGHWRASRVLLGSPGEADPTPDPGVVLNEITAHTDFDAPNLPHDSNDWIELYNPTDTEIALTGDWYLSDDEADLAKFALGTLTLPPGGRISFDEVNHFHNPIQTGFGLNKAGEQVFLSYLPGTAEDRVVDAVAFAGQENDFSLGRYPDGNPYWDALPLSRDEANRAPSPRVTLTELMYHPEELSGGSSGIEPEYVELFNPTEGAIDLVNTNGAWRLAGGVDFSFPDNAAIPAGEFVLVVNFDPADAVTRNAFLNRYGVAEDGVTLMGPYDGNLSNGGERVGLERPQAPDGPGEPTSWVVVDEANYFDQSPWPNEADGQGDSLHRLAFDRSGNDPASWTAAAPTPGLIEEGDADTDEDGMPDQWERDHDLDPDDPNDAQADADADGMTNREEFESGTNPRDETSYLHIEIIEPSDAGIRLQFNTVAGKSYRVLYRDRLTEGEWDRLEDVPETASGGMIEVLDSNSGGEGRRYYQLVIPAEP